MYLACAFASIVWSAARLLSGFMLRTLEMLQPSPLRSRLLILFVGPLLGEGGVWPVEEASVGAQERRKVLRSFLGLH